MDARGAAIRNPNDPILQQTKDAFAHVMKAMVPFSMESMVRSRGSGASPAQTAAGFFGVQPAGYRQTHSAEQQRQAESGRKVELTPLQKKLRQQ